jgi:DNA-binding GntR family transcriptional regulator
MVVGLHARVRFLRGMSLREPGRLDRSLAEIRNITELAIAGNAAEASAAAKAHVQRAADAAFAQMLQSSDGSAAVQ